MPLGLKNASEIISTHCVSIDIKEHLASICLTDDKNKVEMKKKESNF